MFPAQGDTVIASFTMTIRRRRLASGAAILSNHAAGVVVGKSRHSDRDAEELLASFKIGLRSLEFFQPDIFERQPVGGLLWAAIQLECHEARGAI